MTSSVRSRSLFLVNVVGCQIGSSGLRAGRLVIHVLDQGQKCFPVNRDLHLVQEALTTRPLFGEELLVVRKAQLEGVSHPFQSQSGT